MTSREKSHRENFDFIFMNLLNVIYKERMHSTVPIDMISMITNEKYDNHIHKAFTIIMISIYQGRFHTSYKK